jgi:Cu2+-exporting ATPase
MVRAGQPFPADGKIIDGSTSVNESLLTGESQPVGKKAGDRIVGGSINLTQPVQAEVDADPEESTISVLGRMLLKSQTHRSRFARVSERYAGWFVALVLIVAAGTALWWLFHDRGTLLPATLAVLVISCPCALSLATPAAIASASRKLMEHGVLLTRTTALEALQGIDTVIFDKTGTLTAGTPRLARIRLNPARAGAGVTDSGAREIAALLEKGAAHPVGKALAIDAGVERSVTGVTYHERGVAGWIDGVSYRLGSARFAGVGPAPQHDGRDSAAPSTVWLADEQGWLACFSLEDRLRAGAAAAVAALEKRGLDLLILSGDQPEAVAAVAGRAGIGAWRAGQSPQQKMAYLKALQDNGKRVLMIGDGVNDAPVLSAADVSMTVSGASELANSTADLILTGNSLQLIEYIFDNAEAARRVIRQNLLWAAGYNLVAVPFAAAGLVLPWMAALGMSLSSLLVVLNSSRLARDRRSGATVLTTSEARA